MYKIICFFLGHKENIKIQVSQGYAIYICDRCNNVFAVKKEIVEQRRKKREMKKQAKFKKDENND